MQEISKPQLLAYALIAIVVGVLGARFLRSGPGATATQLTTSTAPHQSAGVSVTRVGSGPALVDVTGAVRRPGVVRLRVGARVQEAIRRAGGAGPDAELSAVNLAAKVADGVQIVVPHRSQAVAGGGGTAPAPTAGGGAATGVAGTPAGPVNLNTATAEQLDALDGVGPSTAKKIVEYRQQHGGFGSVSDLDRIPGIGPKKVAALRDKVTV